MTNLDGILKSRDITLPTKVHLVKAMAFSVVMYGCESWTLKKAEHGRIDAFELWCWRRLLRVPWTARRSNQSILEEISPLGVHWKDWCWSWSAKTSTTWWEELTHLKRPWCWERLRAGGAGDDRGWDGWMPSLPQWTWLSKLQELVMDREAWRVAVHGVRRVGHDWVTELNWTPLRMVELDENEEIMIPKLLFPHWIFHRFICMPLMCMRGKSLQTCLTLGPCRLEPTRLLCPWGF